MATLARGFRLLLGLSLTLTLVTAGKEKRIVTPQVPRPDLTSVHAVKTFNRVTNVTKVKTREKNFVL